MPDPLPPLRAALSRNRTGCAVVVQVRELETVLAEVEKMREAFRFLSETLTVKDRHLAAMTKDAEVAWAEVERLQAEGDSAQRVIAIQDRQTNSLVRKLDLAVRVLHRLIKEVV